MLSELNGEEEGTFTDERDGKVYKTVKIGNQVWMAENLKYDAPGSVCYENDPRNAEYYGRLYDLETAKKAVPNGWRLPTNTDWHELIRYVGSAKAGKDLKMEHSWMKNGNGTNKFGFAALPGGCGRSGNFDYVGKRGYWWSSSSNSWNIGYNEDMINSCKEYEGELLSVRCFQKCAVKINVQPTIKNVVKIGNSHSARNWKHKTQYESLIKYPKKW
jgi:uncharacterized protein (TIGR02145 family)